MTSHEDRKKTRMGIIIRSLRAATDPDFEKLIAFGAVEWGCSRRTMLEYINQAKLYNADNPEISN